MNKYSFVIPVYNRPQEIRELLESLVSLKFEQPFEVVIVEDGSNERSDTVILEFKQKLNIAYYYKNNSGPGDSRNYGMARAKSDYFIILDSDCLLPPEYLSEVDNFLSKSFFHCYGGADAAHESFTALQKAINYVMTSFLTTGGIRGNKKTIQKFEPRSFNMGFSKEAFEVTGGFGKIHPGEDPDLSQRILNAGFQTVYIPNAYVYHKRRISWRKFYVQVKKFGLARPILNKWHPNLSKITFWFPSLFVAFTVISIVAAVFLNWIFILPILIYILMILIHATAKTKSLYIGILSVLAMFIQFFGYGLAFIKSYIFVRVLNKDPKKQFPFLFFK